MPAELFAIDIPDDILRVAQADALVVGADILPQRLEFRGQEHEETRLKLAMIEQLTMEAMRARRPSSKKEKIIDKIYLGKEVPVDDPEAYEPGQTLSLDVFKIGDRVVNDVRSKDRNIAMVFQNYALYPHMDVYRNMAFALKLRKFPKEEIDRRVRKAADILGIVPLLERKPKQLSGGQRQRVAVGRAIVREPEVFLFDEPLSNLDAKLRVTMRAEITKLQHKLETTMIYVTHDQVEAMTMGDRIVIMKDGYIMQVGSPLELYNFPDNEFVAGFIGSPAMNFFPAKLVQADGGLAVDTGTFQVRIPKEYHDVCGSYKDKDVTLGIRPEDIADALPEDTKGQWEKFNAVVEGIEPLGAEIILEMVSGQQSFTARVAPGVVGSGPWPWP